MRPKVSQRGILSIIAAFAFCFGIEIAKTAAARAAQEPSVQQTQNLEKATQLIKDGKYAEAETLARELLKQAEAAPGADSLKVAEVLDVLVEALYRGGKANMPESRALAERAVSIKEKTLGADHLELATSLHSLGAVLFMKRDYAGAKPFYERALAIREKALGPEHPEVATILNDLANLLRASREYDKARPLHERALAIREKALGPEHPEVASSLNNLARLLVANHDYAGAKPLYERALAIREKALGPEHPDVARTLNNLAFSLEQMEDYAGAKPLYERALAIREKALGPEHPEVANTLNNLANLLLRTRDYAGAKPLYERALAIQEKALGPEHPDVARTLDNIASLLELMVDYAGAKPLYERALAIQEKALAPEHYEFASRLNSLAVFLHRLGDYAGAMSLFERALAIREKTLGHQHTDVAGTLNDFANLLKHMGDYARAKLFYERSLAIEEKGRGPEHHYVATSLNNLANLLMESGDYVGARPLHQRALAIREKSLGPTNRFVGSSLMNLANLHRNLGDYAEAAPLYQRAIAIREKALGADHPEVAMAINDFAILLMYTGDYAGARSLHDRSLAITEKAFGPNHPDVATSLNDLAKLLLHTGDYAEARPLFERALAIREKALGPEHWRVAQSLDNLASLCIAMGDYANARPLSERALSIYEKAFGPNYHIAAGSLYSLARVFYKTGNAAKALDAALRAEQITREHFRLTARTLAERQALRYAVTRTSGLDFALSIASEGSVMDSTQRVFDALIRTRALVLDEMASRHRTVSSANDSNLVRLSQTLVSARQRLANLTIRGAGDDNLERYLRLLDEARQEKERAEQALAEKSAAFRQEQARSRIGFADVAATLSSGSAMVAFVRYDHHKPTTKESASMPPNSGMETTGKTPTNVDELVPSYLAFILHGGESKPAVAPLGNAQEIETLISRWSEEVARGIMAPGRSQKQAEAAYRTAGELLRQKIWDPIAAHLQGASQIFVVPDGAINLVSLAALPARQSDYLVESGPLIHYLSAERDLVPSESSVTAGEGLLALGGLAFNATTLFADLGRQGRKSAASSPAQTRTSQTYRGSRTSCGDFQSMHFEPLPASEREVKEIISLWMKDNAPERKTGEVVNLTRAAANETAFKERAPGRRVLHLATHGFFLGGSCPSALAASRGVGGVKKVEPDQPAPVAGDSPLLLSGLVLAGANHRAQAGPEEEDGILTAEEIAAMDLSSVEWAVLSACETGLGKVEAGEGVFGLRRAFQVAGARTLIMSLWSVEDESARQWMRALYEGRLVKKLSTAESVRAASLEVLRSRREKGQSTHPFFWAGFVAAGDWK